MYERELLDKAMTAISWIVRLGILFLCCSLSVRAIEAAARPKLLVRVKPVEGKSGKASLWSAHLERFLAAAFESRVKLMQGPLRAVLSSVGKKGDLRLHIEGRGIFTRGENFPVIARLEGDILLEKAASGLSRGRLRGDALRLENLSLHIPLESLARCRSEGGFDPRKLGVLRPGGSCRLLRWKSYSSSNKLALAEGLASGLRIGRKSATVRNLSKRSVAWLHAFVPSYFPHQLVEVFWQPGALAGGTVGGRVLLALVDGKPLKMLPRMVLETEICRWLEELHRRMDEVWRSRTWVKKLFFDKSGLHGELLGLVNRDGELWSVGAALRLERRPAGMEIHPYR